jgi:exopolyphosphatase/guanosine-5'-triphosphate,3'-diphosphate pyrophosphatase
LAAIATERLLDRAKLVGGMLRVVYLFSASMPGIVHDLTFRRSANPEIDLEFVVPKAHEIFAGERLDGRLTQLSKLTGKRLAFVFE